MTPAVRRRFLLFPAALAFGWALLGGSGEALAALSIVQTKGLSFGICEKITGLVVVVLPNSGSQSNQCGSQNAAVLNISGGAPNQTVTVTLPLSRAIKQGGFPNITVNTFKFSTASGLTFGRTGSFKLDSAGSMVIFVGATAQAQPAGAGTSYTGTGAVSVL
jgi:hypothetical protein